jgi:hypothetical protein
MIFLQANEGGCGSYPVPTIPREGEGVTFGANYLSGYLRHVFHMLCT